MAVVDLRFETFNLIYRDPVLRALLSNYANRLEYGGPSSTMANDDCFLVLAWTGGEQLDAPIGTEMLTVQVRIPRPGWSGPRYLDAALQRLEAALSDDAAKQRVASRCVRRSGQARDGDNDTIFKSSTFQIAPAQSRVDASAPLQLAPWPACADLRLVDLIAASPPGASLN
jgi:hypothetical protein